MAAPLTARAEQFVLFDATFTYTWDDAMNSSPSKSHYYVTNSNWLNKARPTNWSAPVDYRDGTVHIHLEVLEKPAGNQQAGWALCYVGNSGSYGCPYTPYYTQTGVYERDVDMHSFFNNATIDWTRGISEVDLVYTVNDSGSGHITNFPNLKDLVTPTRVRMSMVQVSQGSKYDPSILGDAGVEAGSPRDSGADALAPMDASSDASGSGGTGGGGTGGSPGVGGAGGDSTTGAGGLGSTTTGQGGATSGPMQGTGGGPGSTTTGSGGSQAAHDDAMGSCACSLGSPRGRVGFWSASIAALAVLGIRARSRPRRRDSRRTFAARR
jgi:hypothetical protein